MKCRFFTLESKKRHEKGVCLCQWGKIESACSTQDLVDSEPCADSHTPYSKSRSSYLWSRHSDSLTLPTNVKFSQPYVILSHFPKETTVGPFPSCVSSQDFSSVVVCPLLRNMKAAD